MVNRRRVVLPFFGLALFFAIIVAKLFYLQIWNHAVLSDRVQRLVYRERPETPCRGMIFDRNGRVLAMSVRNYTLFLDPKIIENPAQVEESLRREHIRVPSSLITASRSTSYLPVAKNIDMDTMKRIKALNIRGIGFEPDYKRRYPEGKMASHVLGIVGRDGKGLEGIELVANSYLYGDAVNASRYRDGRGREIADRLIDPDDMRGADVYLTIDRNLQFIAEQEIDEAWRKTGARRVMVIIQDPRSGQILAMASRPNFNPEAAGGAAHLRNPAVSDVFEPGSTFKLITAAAALEERAVRRNEYIYCENGRYPVFRHTIKDHEPKGSITFNEVMECSSNIGVAKVSLRLGKEKLYRYARQFGFYSLSGIELRGEARGLLKPPDRWSGLSLPIIAFGQEIGVTAIQLINAYSAVANGGTLLEPRIIDRVVAPTGETLYTSEKRVVRRAVSEETTVQLKGILENIVEKGTGKTAQVPGYSVGGKTGTAQMRDPVTGRYSSSCYVASFCGMIPLSSPRLTIFVVIDQPKGGYYASEVACPVFSRIAARAVRYLKIPPDRDTVQMAMCPEYDVYAAAAPERERTQRHPKGKKV